MNFHELNECVNKILNEEVVIYKGEGKHKVILQLPDGTKREEIVNLYVTATGHAMYDKNIYGVEPQLAVGGYVTDDEYDYDEDDVEIEDEEWERLDLPQGTVVDTILSIEEPIDWDIYDIYNEEPEYEPEDY